MKFWLLERRADDVGYGEAAGFVVAAENAAKARALVAGTVSGGPGDEGSSAWLDPAQSTCLPLVARMFDEQVILRDFRAG